MPSHHVDLDCQIAANAWRVVKCIFVAAALAVRGAWSSELKAKDSEPSQRSARRGKSARCLLATLLFPRHPGANRPQRRCRDGAIDCTPTLPAAQAPKQEPLPSSLGVPALQQQPQPAQSLQHEDDDDDDAEAEGWSAQVQRGGQQTMEVSTRSKQMVSHPPKGLLRACHAMYTHGAGRAGVGSGQRPHLTADIDIRGPADLPGLCSVSTVLLGEGKTQLFDERALVGLSSAASVKAGAGE